MPMNISWSNASQPNSWKKPSKFVLSKAWAPAGMTSRPNTAQKTTISVVLSMTWAWAGLTATETEQFNCNMSVVLLHTPGHIVANSLMSDDPCCIQGNSPIKECHQQESVHIAVLTMTSYLLTLCYTTKTWICTQLQEQVVHQHFNNRLNNIVGLLSFPFSA
jgi:hypothetical protein